MSSKVDGMSRLAPAEAAALLASFVDTLIPGGGPWPSASAVGVHGVLALRLCESGGEAALGRVLATVLGACGDLSGKTAEERQAAVAALESAEPAFFDKIRADVALTYYESAFVVEAIRKSGRPYAQKPHLSGYPMPKFDLQKDRPSHGRGGYLKTDQVRSIDISDLKLDETRTERWGLER